MEFGLTSPIAWQFCCECLSFFGSDFSDISFNYSSLSIKVLISLIILDAIGWKSGTWKCNQIQKGQALNCMYVPGCAVHTGKIKFFLFFKAKNVSHCWKLYWSMEDYAHVERREFSMLTSTILKISKNSLDFFRNFECICMEEERGNLSRTFINGLSSVLIKEWSTLTCLSTWVH